MLEAWTRLYPRSDLLEIRTTAPLTNKQSPEFRAGLQRQPQDWLLFSLRLYRRHPQAHNAHI